MGVKGKPELGNEAPAVNEAEVPVIVKLPIPHALYAEYKTLAGKQDLTVAELMLNRLQRCRTHSSLRSLYFQTSQLTQLEQLLQKRPIETSEQALALLGNALSVRVGDFPPISLSAAQIKRLQLAPYRGQTVEDRLADIVKKAVSMAVGI